MCKFKGGQTRPPTSAEHDQSACDCNKLIAKHMAVTQKSFSWQFPNNFSAFLKAHKYILWWNFDGILVFDWFGSYFVPPREVYRSYRWGGLRVEDYLSSYVPINRPKPSDTLTFQMGRGIDLGPRAPTPNASEDVPKNWNSPEKLSVLRFLHFPEKSVTFGTGSWSDLVIKSQLKIDSKTILIFWHTSISVLSYCMDEIAWNYRSWDKGVSHWSKVRSKLAFRITKLTK